MKKIVALILTAASVLGLCACGSAKTVNEHITFSPLPAEQSSLLNYNPDRAWRLEAYVSVAPIKGQPDPTDQIRERINRYAKYTPQLVQTYFYLDGYKDTETIPQEGFDRIQQVFDCAEELGIKLVVRFAYQGDMQGTGEASDDIMLAHMKQLKPILEKNVKRINVVEAGFLGAWGEWHSYKQFHNPTALLRGIMDMVPESLYVQVREPEYKNLLLPTEDIYSRIGFHDDSFFGRRYCYMAGDLNPGTDDWNQIMKESAYYPQGGETFWGYETNEEINGFDSILQFSEFRQNIFSLYHCFIEDGAGKGYEMEKWTTTKITPDWLESNHIAYSPNWFGENGEVERTVFDFVSDYMGYRLEAQEANISGTVKKGGNLKVEFKLINYGFSAAFNLKSGFAILDENNKVVCEVPAGNPETWNSRNPEDYSDAALIEYSIGSEVTLPKQSGKYKVAFYLKNSADTGARLNNDMPYSDGYSVFYEFEL